MADTKSNDDIFTTFIVGLAYTARIHLGEQLHPESDSVQMNRPLARQVIKQVEMLERKTKGNLSDSEEALLMDLLTDLKMRYAKTG